MRKGQTYTQIEDNPPLGDMCYDEDNIVLYDLPVSF